MKIGVAEQIQPDEKPTDQTHHFGAVPAESFILLLCFDPPSLIPVGLEGTHLVPSPSIAMPPTQEGFPRRKEDAENLVEKLL